MRIINSQMMNNRMMNFYDYMCMYMCGIMDYLRVHLIIRFVV
ncbi:hypothetical protein [Aminipila luticellarii]|nr:hypothetical protein [Aminipila luticellarii]